MIGERDGSRDDAEPGVRAGVDRRDVDHALRFAVVPVVYDEALRQRPLGRLRRVPVPSVVVMTRVPVGMAVVVHRGYGVGDPGEQDGDRQQRDAMNGARTKRHVL